MIIMQSLQINRKLHQFVVKFKTPLTCALRTDTYVFHPKLREVYSVHLIQL